MKIVPKIPKFILRNLQAAHYHMCRLGKPLHPIAERELLDGLHSWADAVQISRLASRKNNKAKSQNKTLSRIRKELSIFKQSLERHKKPNHVRTERLLCGLSSDTKAILNASFKSRIYLQIDDFSKIDLANSVHRTTLLEALEGMRCSLDEFDEPKFNSALDQAFYCLADVYEVTTGRCARIGATYDNLAKSSFDKAVLATYRMGRPLGDYKTEDTIAKTKTYKEKSKFKIAAHAYNAAIARRP